MTVAASSSRTSWAVSDRDVAAELSALMSLTDDESRLLSALHDTATSAAVEMADAFYTRLTAHDNTAEYFDGHDMSRLHGTIAKWFTNLFSGTYDDAYVAQRLRIGEVHVHIGLPVRYPLAMLDVVSEHGDAVAATSDTPEAAQRAFRKVLALDVAIFNHAYESNQLQHLSDLVGGERLARRLLMGGA